MPLFLPFGYLNEESVCARLTLGAEWSFWFTWSTCFHSPSILASREATEGTVYPFSQVLYNLTFIRVRHEGLLGTCSATKNVLFFLFPFSTSFTLTLSGEDLRKEKRWVVSLFQILRNPAALSILGEILGPKPDSAVWPPCHAHFK